MLGEDKLYDEFKDVLESYVNSTGYHSFIHGDIKHIHAVGTGVFDLNTVDGVNKVLDELRYLEWRGSAFFNLAVMLLWYNGKLEDDEFLKCVDLVSEVYSNREKIMEAKIKAMENEE